MSETDPATLPPVMSGEEPATTTSVIAKLTNIFVDPGAAWTFIPYAIIFGALILSGIGGG